MSYFMTISGSLPDTSGKVEFVPASHAQEYIQRLEADIAATDGSPLYLVDDKESGTSSNFITQAENEFHMTGTIKDTDFMNLLKACVLNGNPFRIWWAFDRSAVHRQVVRCTTLEMLISTIIDQFKRQRDLAIEFRKE